MKKEKGVAFRLRGKPTRPKREKRKAEYSISWESLARALDIVESYGVSPEDAIIEVDEDRAQLVFEYDEPEEIFQERLQTYEKRLAGWQAWYDEHQGEIEAELARRGEIAQQKAAKAEERGKARAALEIVKLEKQLARMKREARS
ncbi:MAG: hypothetical protein ACFFD4_38965 [Candidatus Odinarchaeota archaeon]